MSGRGGKRRQVLQLGSASKLHRYGYSKGFHSKDKKGKETVPILVGNYSDSDSESSEEAEEQITKDVNNEEEDIVSGHTTADVDPSSVATIPDTIDGSVIQEKPADMDNELKNFLSEIEAIAVPTELNGDEQVKPPDAETNLESHDEAAEDAPKPTTKPGQSSHHYSMFVKGESEFVHSPKQTMDGGVESSQTEIKEEEIPEEPITNWHMVQDESSQYYYYWNTATNEVTWEIPTEYTQFLLLHREYEEKIAKFTPEQLQKLKEKRSKTAVSESNVKHSNEETCLHHSEREEKSSETLSSASSAKRELDGRSNKATSDAEYVYGTVRDVSPSKSLSPHPEASQGSRHHKHKKEKRSHHKKKHKRKHGDSDEEKLSPKSSDIGQQTLSSESTNNAVIAGPKLLSIVPYLSDQDDDEDENSDLVPQLGLAPVSTTESVVRESKEHSIQAGEPSELEITTTSASADSKDMVAKDTSQLSPLSQTTDARVPSLLLLPPPPPPEEEEPIKDQKEEDILNFERNITDESGEACSNTHEDPPKSSFQTNSDKCLTDSGDHSLITQLADKQISEIMGAIVDTSSVVQVTENETNLHSAPKHDSNVQVDSDVKLLEKSKSTTREVDSDVKLLEKSKSTTREVDSDVKLLEKSKSTTREVDSDVKLLEKSKSTTREVDSDVKLLEKSKSTTREVIDMFAEHFPMPASPQKKDAAAAVGNGSTDTDSHVKEVPKKLDPSEEVIEEGEIQEVPEKETAVVHKKRHTTSKWTPEIISEKKKGEAKVQKTMPKSLNIVGYASDDEEEEGEVREKVSKKEEKPSPAKQRKKDKKKESKKHRQGTKTELSTSVDNKLDKKIVSTVPVTLDQVIPKVTSQSVSEMIPEKSLDDDGDIDFDVDDIDRALEIALEKKLEKKKAEQQAKVDDKENKLKDEVVNNTVSEEPIPKQLISDTAVIQTQICDTNAPEVSTNQDGTAHAIKKPLLDSESKTSEDDDVKHMTDIKEMAELALNKLEFLDISTDNLSRLQVLFIELQTRYTDWTAGGLSTQYFYEQLKVAEGLLEQYELSAVPEGWACQWDRANNRYYYRNTVTNRIQWEYPEVENKANGETPSVTVNSNESVTKIRDKGSDEHRRSKSSGSGRHRKRDDKDKSKHDRRSSSRHYHRKRRRGRDQSNSSNTSVESQSHRHHRKSKKKKRHRSERSPSVQIMETIDGVEVIEEVLDSPEKTLQPASPSLSQSSDVVAVSAELDTADAAQDGLDITQDRDPSQPPVEDVSTVVELDQEVEGGSVADAEIDTKEEPAEVVNPAVISKPPQIIAHPQLIAPDGHMPAELYSAPQIAASASPSFYSSYSLAQPTDQVPPAAEVAPESSETSMETDKSTKKKKKDKKPLATGSSIMMKKKHMTSMVQKWQKVKIEVEKEDRAKELRQAAIRKKIEELKSSDKP